jgi:hypothetical protein
MNRWPKSLLVAAMVFPLLGATADDAVRGCAHTLNGLWVRPYTSSMMVDGVLLHTGWDSGPEGAPLGGLDLSAEEIVHIWPGCLEIEMDGGTVGVRLVSIITRDGAIGVMRSFLRDLATHYWDDVALSGHGAQVLPRSSQFYASRPPVPIQLVAADGMRTATMSFEGFETSCQVSWPDSRIDRVESSAVQVSCRQREDVISP